MSANRVIFFIFDHVHLLDLAGAVTVFYESGCCGNNYEIRYVSPYHKPVTSSGLGFSNIEPLKSVTVNKNDMVIVAGMEIKKWDRADDHLWIPWLQDAAATGATISSICTAAFALAAAGLLNGHTCTTHWAWTAALQREYPLLKVIENKLFVQSGRIFTSAGISTGIDLALYFIEEQHGAAFACVVAKDMVVYIRRDGMEAQNSIYLQNRQHINHSIHMVQDYITRHLHEKLIIDELAQLVFISPRNLTRLFKSVTGITIGKYIQSLRQEKAKQLLKTNHKLAWVAKECGFSNPAQLRKIIKEAQH
ncbi:Transcriptional regulator GlxA family, contains an amidase domain and an AraC-type DNA-binding HTH domain [Pedobacter terrae]|uniref:Transcriptional regulator GlxA family, contains an amidase domain and an AraC-type DNA-binding HTH domain n=1 Tax=Pedobacter terrae TaxID=405671 RepID=A0A1G7Q6K5_9SPHI|nr:DJ-1/PfpI family protein [Pedobacter terrae]SDF93220.1 Transcriptional regulator GlxA family, contains an amidase domain and an AraC-type DNA-binding HTH domain [Pedobacter terrae]